MRIAPIAAVLACLAAGIAPAAAQAPEQRIETAMARAREAGIPVALLESKVAEGRAKGVSLERIAAAVERRQAALERAGQMLGGPREADAASLSVAADAVEAGVSAAVLQAVADTAPRERRVVAIAALTQLVELGHVPEAALDRVREALKRGPDALANLPAQAAAEAGGRGRAGGPPDAAGGGASAGRGGSQAAPPAAVPSPGGSQQPARPGGPPAAPGRSNNPGAGRGAGGA